MQNMKDKNKKNEINHTEKKEKKKISNSAIWTIKITIITLLLSIFVSFLTEIASEKSNVIISILVLMLLIVVSIIFDTIGVAAASCDIAPLLSMASRKVKGATQAVKLVNNAEKVSNICADVIGDICGIISGSCSATIVIMFASNNPNEYIFNILMSSVVAAITVGGKAFFKKIAIKKSKDIMLLAGKIISIFSKKNKIMRLDIYLTERNFTQSRTRAKNLIEMGNVLVDGIIITKPAYEICGHENVAIVENYEASLGSLKLKKALNEFNIDVKNKICLDLGASNGGFTEVLLNNGANLIYALDIGECALPKYLKTNPKIIVKDRTNARFIKKSDFQYEIELCTVDLSFISLELVLPSIYNVLKNNGEVIALIKPQFELNKNSLTKTGIVKTEKLRLSAIENIQKFSSSLGFNVKGVILAPHPFEYKNQEYLIFLNM